jgi:hypothetical protein
MFVEFSILEGHLDMPTIAKELMVYVSTDEWKGCPMTGCEFYMGSGKFEESCNHLLQAHGLKCLHVGQETGEDSSGKPWHKTVAVFGK